MAIGGSKASQFTVELDKDTKAQVYAFKMRLKLKDASSEVTGTHFAYRYSSDFIKHQFISINKNSLNVGGHSLGALSADEWTELEVILDFRTLTGEVFCGESTYRRTFDLYPIASSQIVMYASPNVSGLCLDDLQIYTKASLYVSKPADEANKNAELIVPDTPIPEGFEAVDIPPMDYAMCYLQAKEGSPDFYTPETHSQCLEAIRAKGMTRYEDNWCIERYQCPRFTTPDENGNVILDYGISIQ